MTNSLIAVLEAGDPKVIPNAPFREMDRVAQLLSQQQTPAALRQAPMPMDADRDGGRFVVRSRHPNALPLLMTHGWPGSIVEHLKVIGPLTDPTAHGGRAEDAFDLVLPSMPGYGFSERPKTTSWGPDRIARAWAELMERLGYSRYVAQGGDWRQHA